MSVPLQILPGVARGSYSLGYVLSRKNFRDPRFGPSLDYKEASWLLKNEQILNQRDRREGLVQL